MKDTRYSVDSDVSWQPPWPASNLHDSFSKHLLHGNCEPTTERLAHVQFRYLHLAAAFPDYL